MVRICLLIIVAIAIVACPLFGQENTVEILSQQKFSDLPEREGIMLTVEYPPGASSPKHRHNAHTFVYVLEGSVIMQVEGGEKVILKQGDTFYETPEDIHVISMNASKTASAKILVFFVKREGAPISIPVP